MSYFNATGESFTGFSDYHFVQSTIHWIDLRVQPQFLFRDSTLFHTQIDTYMYWYMDNTESNQVPRKLFVCTSRCYALRIMAHTIHKSHLGFYIIVQ